MNIYIGILGELILVEVFVFAIWLGVLFDAVANKDASIAARRLLLTSLGLVFNAFAITGIMVIRAYQLSVGATNFIWPITALYTLLTAGNILFIITAALGRNPKFIQIFVLLTLLWVGVVFYLSYFK